VQGYDFTGFAADPRLRPELALSVDANGRPFFVDNSLNANAGFNGGSLIGYPAFFNTGVSGKYYRQGDAVQVVTINGTPTGGTFTDHRRGVRHVGAGVQRDRRDGADRAAGCRARRSVEHHRHRLRWWPVHDHLRGPLGPGDRSTRSP
jgi:hypothetical protein